MILVAKLCMNNRHQIKKLMATCFLIHSVLHADNKWTKAAADTMAIFLQKAKDYQGKDEDRLQALAIPSIHIFNAWLEIANQMTKDAPEAQKMIQDFTQAISTSENPQLELCTQVPHIMMIQPFDKKTRRVEVGVNGQAAQIYRQIIYPLMKKDKGFRPMPGAAPKSNLERQIQEFLSSHQVAVSSDDY